MIKYEKPKERLEVDFNLSDRLDLPAGTLLAITYSDGLKEHTYNAIECLKGKKKREWFQDHAYFCLPLTMGNQHGFIVKADTDFAVYWNGGDATDDVTVSIPEGYNGPQQIKAHFGMGTFTITNPWFIRTPRGVNTLVMNPPNMYNHGIIHMTACVETDQLRRDFTFNLRVTKAGEWFHVRKGDPVGYMLPYPRHFIDNYRLLVDADGAPEDIVDDERTTAHLFGEERNKIDKKYAGSVGGRYMIGEDIYGNKLRDHQKSLDPYKDQDTKTKLMVERSSDTEKNLGASDKTPPNETPSEGPNEGPNGPQKEKKSGCTFHPFLKKKS
jgi:hypothetical protein